MATTRRAVTPIRAMVAIASILVVACGDESDRDPGGPAPASGDAFLGAYSGHSTLTLIIDGNPETFRNNFSIKLEPGPEGTIQTLGASACSETFDVVDNKTLRLRPTACTTTDADGCALSLIVESGTCTLSQGRLVCSYSGRYEWRCPDGSTSEGGMSMTWTGDRRAS